MAISKPSVAGRPATERRTIHEQSFSPRGVGPEETGLDVVNGSLVDVPPVTPEREGQLSFTVSVDESGLNRSCTIYAVVDIGGVLTWKTVTPVPNIISKYTGKPFDPIYD